MRKVLVAVALTVGATVAVMNMTQPVQAGHNYYEQDDGWDTEHNRKCARNKRKCVEVASNLAYRMAQSGEYANLNDDEFAQLATRIAAHIVDSAYDHDETSPLAP